MALKNNKIFSISITGNTMSFSWLDQSIILSIDSKNNMRIEVSIYSNMQCCALHQQKIKIPSIIAAPFRGLCGTPNSDSSDDLMKPDGKLAENTLDFTSSWKNPNSNVTCTPFSCSNKDKKELSLEICTNIP
jgi:von Willebrand factor type D domain